MNFPLWPEDADAARAEQARLAPLVRVADDFPDPPRRIVALDAHYDDAAGLTFAAAALICCPDLTLQKSVVVSHPTRFPYVSGLLSFREAPAMLMALSLLAQSPLPDAPPPDMLVVDGQGTAHPRRFGLACHIGVLTGLPTIGVAKTRLTGRFDPPGDERGAWSPLIHRKQWVGAALRSRAGCRPIFLSPGHRVSLPTAVALTMSFTGRWRLPEPIRLADALSRMHGTAPAAAP